MTTTTEHGTADLLEFLAAEELTRPVPKTPAAYPHHKVTAATASILELMDGDPLHAADRERIVTAIVTVASEHDGAVDPNEVRAKLANPQGDLVVYPRLVGSTYQALTTRGVLEFVGWTTNEDTHGRNAGRPARTYRLTRQLAEEN